MYKVTTPWGIMVCNNFSEMFNLKCNLIILERTRKNLKAGGTYEN